MSNSWFIIKFRKSLTNLSATHSHTLQGEPQFWCPKSLMCKGEFHIFNIYLLITCELISVLHNIIIHYLLIIFNVWWHFSVWVQQPYISYLLKWGNDLLLLLTILKIDFSALRCITNPNIGLHNSLLTHSGEVFGVIGELEPKSSQKLQIKKLDSKWTLSATHKST